MQPQPQQKQPQQPQPQQPPTAAATAHEQSQPAMDRCTSRVSPRISGGSSHASSSAPCSSRLVSPISAVRHSCSVSSTPSLTSMRRTLSARRPRSCDSWDGSLRAQSGGGRADGKGRWFGGPTRLQHALPLSAAGTKQPSAQPSTTDVSRMQPSSQVCMDGGSLRAGGRQRAEEAMLRRALPGPPAQPQCSIPAQTRAAAYCLHVAHRAVSSTPT